MNDITKDEIPLGLGMALAQNVPAFEEFANLTEDQKRAVIEGSRKVGSKSEMKSYVNKISGKNFR